MISENAKNYENVVIRNEQEVGINNFGLDYMVGLEDEIERLHSIIKEVRESAKNKIKQYESYIHDLKIGDFSEETKHKEKIELIFRIREQEELLEILDKENKQCTNCGQENE